ncbi:MAG: hypothetical protein M1835_005412 [Candelina submexicana]|nr:MAG: hypothetical protein M1835_005412 [Candelina submexicana]
MSGHHHHHHYQPPAAFCEDYNSDVSESLPETRKVASQTSRRKSKNGLSSAKAADHALDVASDSGYSSHAATVTSSDSGGQKPQPGTLKLDTSVNPSKQRPTPIEPKMNSSQKISDKEPTRATPRNIRPDNTHPDGCRCGGCLGRGRAPPTPLETPWDINYFPLNQQSPYPGPPSPQSARYLPPIYAHEAPVVHTARPRASTSGSQRAARPMSYHAGSLPTGLYMAQSYTPVFERGPPPAVSAYSHAPPPPKPYPDPITSYAPPPVSAPPRQAYLPPPSPYDQSRPRPRQWTSEHYASRPTSLYGPPVVDYDSPAYSAPQSNRRSSFREPPLVEAQERDEDYYRMPPPQVVPARRPSVRHATTTASGRDIHRRVAVDPSDAGATVTHDRSRQASKESSRSRRPSLASASSSRKSTSYANANGSARISVESASRRRASYYGHERRNDLERRQRDAEEYQDTITKTTPLTAEALRAARRGTNRGNSDAGNSRTDSSKEGSGIRTRSGSEVVNSEADNFTMRFSTAAGVKLDFSGDMEGRTISLKPGDDGAHAELSIGSRPKPRYVDRNSNAQSEYARSGLRRDQEDERRARENRTSERSLRRSSRFGFGRRSDN